MNVCMVSHNQARNSNKVFSLNRVIPGVGNASACVVRERIYVTGGHYGHRGSCTYELIQVYTADDDQWSIITGNPHPGTDQRGRGREGLSAHRGPGAPPLTPP